MAQDRKGYIHGYSTSEQDRLYQQARFLEERLYSSVDFSRAKRILEVGSGVGAQTEILLERFPHLHIDCVDSSEAQLERARKHLKGAVADGRAETDRNNASCCKRPLGNKKPLLILKLSVRACALLHGCGSRPKRAPRATHLYCGLRTTRRRPSVCRSI